MDWPFLKSLIPHFIHFLIILSVSNPFLNLYYTPHRVSSIQDQSFRNKNGRIRKKGSGIWNFFFPYNFPSFPTTSLLIPIIFLRSSSLPLLGKTISLPFPPSPITSLPSPTLLFLSFLSHHFPSHPFLPHHFPTFPITSINFTLLPLLPKIFPLPSRSKVPEGICLNSCA